MGGGSSNTVQKSDPWSGIQSYLAGDPSTGMQGVYGNAYNWFNGQNPQYYPGQTVASPSQATLDSENQTLARAQAGSPLDAQAKAYYSSMASGAQLAGDPTAQGQALANDPAAQGRLLANDNTANGAYLGSNPYLSQMVDAAGADTTRNFSNTVMPGIASQFATGGRFGSGQQMQGISDANNNLAKQLSGMSSNIYGNAYQQERGLQENAIGRDMGLQQNAVTRDMSAQQAAQSRDMGYQANAASMLPSMSNLDYNNLAKIAAVGSQQDQRNQALMNSNVARWDYGQNTPLNKLQAYSQILQGFGGLGGQVSSQTTAPSGSLLSNALGAGMVGNSLYGLGAGAGLYGAGAAGLGALGSMGLGSGAMLGGATGLAATGALGGVSAGAGLFSTAAPLMALAL